MPVSVGQVRSRHQQAVLVSASAVLVLLARPAVADLCAARVELEGEAPVVGEVGTELARLGVERGKAAPGCRGVLARVEIDREGGIAVAIRDGAKRSEGRVVSDATIAASWIDSWLHDDLDGRAWLISSPVSMTAPPIAPIAATSTVAMPNVQSNLLERMHVAVGWEHVWTDDGASADGIGVASCVRVGRACVGGRARYVREADRTVELTAMTRNDLSLMATVSLPLRAGRMSIAPELGLGLGRMATQRIDGCAPDPNTMPGPNCDPMDPTCIPPPSTCTDAAGKIYVGDNFATATISPRLSAGLKIAVPLFEHVWLDGLASVSATPFAHGDPFGGGASMVDPDGTVVPGTGSEFALPGEPTLGLWLGIGLRIGGP